MHRLVVAFHMVCVEVGACGIRLACLFLHLTGLDRFVAASYGVGLYFQNFTGPTALGFAGSFVVIIFLAYFLSSVFLFGAEVTKVYERMLDGRETGAIAAGGSDDPQVVVAEPRDSVPRAAIIAFFAGLLVGWKRGR